MSKVATPNRTRCEDVADLLKLPLEKSVKAIAVMHDDQFVLLLLRGDHNLNEIKVGKLPGLDPFRFATDAEIVAALGCNPATSDRSASTPARCASLLTARLLP